MGMIKEKLDKAIVHLCDKKNIYNELPESQVKLFETAIREGQRDKYSKQFVLVTDNKELIELAKQINHFRAKEVKAVLDDNDLTVGDLILWPKDLPKPI